MKNQVLLSLLFTLVSGRPDAVCGAVCANAITGIGTLAVPLASRTFDCSNYLETTTTPALSTVLITTSIDLASYGYHDFGPTTIPEPTPGPIPAYANDYCLDAEAYAAACSCLGVEAVTRTAPAPTVAVYDKLPNCVNPVSCADVSSGGICGGGSGTCVADERGLGWCIAGFDCGKADACSLNADCPSGVCLINSCCGGNICLTTTLDSLVEEWHVPGSGKMKLAKKGLSDAGPSHRSV